MLARLHSENANMKKGDIIQGTLGKERKRLRRHLAKFTVICFSSLKAN
jgi:hypothetical protein